MIEAQTLPLPSRRRGPWLAVIAVALIAIAAAGAIAIPLAMRDDGTSTPPGIINYITESGEFTIDASGKPAERVVAPPLQLIPAADAGEFSAPDSSVVAFAEQATDGGTWLALREGIDSARLAQLSSPGDPLLFNGDKSAARSFGGIPLVVSWSPDGRYLAYGTVSGVPYTLHVFDRNTGATHDFAVPDGYVGEAAWSPDGQHLAMSSYSVDRLYHTIYLWDPGNGSFTELIDGCHLIWAPDSRHLVLHRDPYVEPGIWVLSVEGGERYALTDEPSGFPMAWVSEEER